MKVLEIFDQPEAEYLGEAYVAVTPDSIKEMLVRINPDGELNEEDIEIIMEVEKWEEKDGYSVMF